MRDQHRADCAFAPPMMDVGLGGRITGTAAKLKATPPLLSVQHLLRLSGLSCFYLFIFCFFQFEFIPAFQSQPRGALTLLSDPLVIGALSESRVAIDAVPRERGSVEGGAFMPCAF